MRGIATVGTCVPRYRLPATEIEEAWGSSPKGIEHVAIPGPDEDAVTMAVAAAEDALSHTNVTREEIAFLGLATTTPPLEEELLCGRLARMLALPRDLATRAATQSTLGGGRLLADALEREGTALVIAADAPYSEPETPMGAGAVALLVREEAAVPIADVASHTDDAPGLRFRERGADRVDGIGVTSYERSVLREHVTRAVEGLDRDLEEIDAAAIHQPSGGTPYRAGSDLFATEAISRGTVVDRVGDAGAAGVPLGLCETLAGATESETTVAAFFASGSGAIALACEGSLDRSFELDTGVEIEYSRYLRERGYIVDGEVAGGGANVSLPSWQRSLDQRYRLVGGRCPDCGTLVFPPEGACPECHGLVEYDLEELPREGEVVARTVIGRGGAPPEFADQQARDGAFCVAIVDLGARLPAQVVDCHPETVAVGDRVRAVIRKLYEQEGISRYGVKFVPND